MTDSHTLATRFDADLVRQAGLCRELEGLADSLPRRLDTHGAMDLAERLHPTLRMLRGLFTSRRGLLAFDRDYVLPLYRRSCGL